MSHNDLFESTLKVNPFQEAEPVKEEKKSVNEQGEPVTADGEDIVLLVMNEKPIYDQYMMAVKNLKRKKEKGNYDHDLAVKMMLYPAKAGAQAWYKATRAYYDDGTQVLQPSPDAIRQAAEQLRDDFEAESDLGNY